MNAPNAELTARVTTAVRAERTAKIDDLGRGAVLWLAVVPLWTRSAAQAAGFPASRVVEFVKRARDAGWCETRGSLRETGSGELRFWMPDEVRRTVLDLLGPQVQVLDDARTVASRVARLLGTAGTGTGTRTGAGPDTAVLPGALRDWAELLRGPDQPDLMLVTRVGRAVEARDLSGAQQLVSAGEALAPLLAGTMELAVDRARRLLSLGTRRRRDDRALERYLDRPELSGAVSSLLRPDSERWALHLRGIGGAGKTMLIRYLAAGRYAFERELAAIPIARADFDHMNPDYPVRRPVQLLLELADELSLHTAAVSRADQALAQFRATAVSVHESLSSAREETRVPLQNPQVLNAIDTFADAIGQFPGGALLILDTCEELGKADSGDPAAPTVTTTLAIIERIHQRAPSVRVLFAGRWPLPGRPYLEVQEVTGFTVDEARSYLAAFSQRPLPVDLADAMIRQSPAADAAVPAPGELPGRVSPFDLALYQSWADEDDELDVSRVAQGSDAYVEGRIIERLRDPAVISALPVLACAGRCRVATVASFLGADQAVLGPRLAEQEWIDSAGDPPTHVTATPALAARLRRYFSTPDRAERFTAETARLARVLRDAALGPPVADIDPDELLAALRLSAPADAARLWDATAERAGSARRWNWLLNVTRRVLGESADEQWPTADALRATVLASYIATSRRASPLFDARAAWGEVRTWADRHPDEETGRFLLTRAALGSLPYAPDDEGTWAAFSNGFPDPDNWPARSAELLAAAADAAHRLLEEGAEAAAERLLAHDRMNDMLLAASGSEAIPGQQPHPASTRAHAWRLVALARLRTDDQRPAALGALQVAENWVQQADAADDATTQAASEPAWADWIAADDLLTRVRIERGLIAPPGDEELAAWESYAAGHLGSIDGERLASLCLRTRLGRGVIEPAVIEQWEQRDYYQPDRVATCSAHDLVPPLCVTLAEAWLAAGEPQRALDLVEQRRAAALETRDDEATVRIADAMTVRIARRLRLFDQRALLSRLSNLEDPDPSRLDLVDSARRAWAVINGTAPYSAGPEVWNRPAGWHAWWQCQANWQVSLVFPRWAAEGTDSGYAADIELDLEELRQAGHPQLLRLEAELAGWLAQRRPAARARSAAPYRDVRTGLRRSVLAGEACAQHPEVPPRQLAEMAFDEAELLEPRSPRSAAVLFRYASSAYAAADDALGRLLAVASAAALDSDEPADPMVEPALARLRAVRPGVAAALTGPLDDAGPWRHWAWFLKQLALTATMRKPTSQVGRTILGGVRGVESAVGRLAEWAAGAVYVGGSLAGLALVAEHLVRYDLPLVLTLLAAAAGLTAAAALATGAWRLRSVARLSRHRAVGGFFGPADLEFSVLVEGQRQPGNGRVDLWINRRPLLTARKRQWARLAILGLASYAGAVFERGHPSGYVGLFRASAGEAGELTWHAGGPVAGGQWWSGGTAAGVIIVSAADAALPWERIITASFGPPAAGRVEWCRQLFVSGASPSRGATRVVLEAPEQWQRYLGRFYDPGTAAGPAGAESPVAVRHAIGRAVATAAGPRLDVSGELTAGSGPAELLGEEELGRGAPSLIVLQAEPVSEEAVAGAPDDLTEKLALAVDLLEATAAAQVLVLPALQAGLAQEVAGVIAGHAASGRASDARGLQRKVRRLLRPSVRPAVLDDVVLFVNRAGFNRSRK